MAIIKLKASFAFVRCQDTLAMQLFGQILCAIFGDVRSGSDVQTMAFFAMSIAQIIGTYRNVVRYDLPLNFEGIMNSQGP